MSRGPVSLFHAANEREKEEAAKRHHVEMIKQGQVNIFEVKEEAGDAMLEQVITKLKAEMDAKESNVYVQGIGEQMLNFLRNNPAVAEQMMDETKSLEGSYQAVEQFAKNNRGSGAAMVTPQKSFEVIMGYYGIGGAVMPLPTVSLPAASTEPNAVPDNPIEQKESPVKRTNFDVSLSELL